MISSRICVLFRRAVTHLVSFLAPPFVMPFCIRWYSDTLSSSYGKCNIRYWIFQISNGITWYVIIMICAEYLWRRWCFSQSGTASIPGFREDCCERVEPWLVLERTEGLGDEHDELRGLEEFGLRLKLKQCLTFNMQCLWPYLLYYLLINLPFIMSVITRYAPLFTAITWWGSKTESLNVFLFLIWLQQVLKESQCVSIWKSTQSSSF